MSCFDCEFVFDNESKVWYQSLCRPKPLKEQQQNKNIQNFNSNASASVRHSLCTYLKLPLPECSCVLLQAGLAQRVNKHPRSACPVTSAPGGPGAARREGAGPHTQPFSPFYLQSAGSGGSSSARYNNFRARAPYLGMVGDLDVKPASVQRQTDSPGETTRRTRRALLNTRPRCPGGSPPPPCSGTPAGPRWPQGCLVPRGFHRRPPPPLPRPDDTAGPVPVGR